MRSSSCLAKGFLKKSRAVPNHWYAPDFSRTNCYQDRSLWYLIKAVAMLKLCSYPYIALNAVRHMKTAESIFGTYFTYDICAKRTIYAFFCAGESDRELQTTIASLEKKSIGAILDYAAEADMEGSVAPAPGANEAPDLSMSTLILKNDLQYLMNENDLENNMKLYMMSLMHASLHSPDQFNSLSAVKVTGMCDPQLLARMSAIVMVIHQLWALCFNPELVPKLEECRVVMGPSLLNQEFITFEQLKAGFERFDPEHPLTDDELLSLQNILDSRKNGKISFVDFKDQLTLAVTALNPSSVQETLVKHLPRLNTIEKELWGSVMRRLRLICSTAKELDVRVLIDAEQTFYQHAIDVMVFMLQKEFNQEQAVVYNTYQCYLTYAQARVVNDMNRAAWHGYQWGGKIVRGAYMLQEHATSRQYNYACPLWSSYEETGKCYMNSSFLILDELCKPNREKWEVFFGTHNDAAVKELCDAVLKFPHLQQQVGFGQLFGMKDNLTIPLAQANFPTYKYVPYGPVKETIHYIGRRAVENSSVLQSGVSERALMLNEILRRVGYRTTTKV